MHPKIYATDVTTVFGRTLAALRVAAGLSQTDLGLLMKMDRTSVARLEIGRTTSSVPIATSAEQVFLRLQAIRRPGDLAALSAQTTQRLLAQGVMVCLDRPPAAVPPLPSRSIILAAEAVLVAWAAELRAEGLRFGEAPEEGEPHTEEPPRLVVSGERLYTTRAKPVESAQRRTRKKAA